MKFIVLGMRRVRLRIIREEGSKHLAMFMQDMHLFQHIIDLSIFRIAI